MINPIYLLLFMLFFVVLLLLLMVKQQVKLQKKLDAAQNETLEKIIAHLKEKEQKE